MHGTVRGRARQMAIRSGAAQRPPFNAMQFPHTRAVVPPSQQQAPRSSHSSQPQASQNQPPPQAQAGASAPHSAEPRGCMPTPHIARRLRTLCYRSDRQFRKAVMEGNVHAVQTMLQNGADPLATLKDGKSALRLAAEARNYHLLSALIDHQSVDPALHPPAQLHYWVEYPAAVQVLAANDKVQPDQRDAEGKTLLHRAAREGRYRVAEALLSRADPALTDPDGRTALHLAAQYDARILRLMLRKGVDPGMRDREGKTPLHVAVAAVRPENFADVFGEFVAANADLDAADNEGNTPLDIAVGMGRYDVVTALLRAGAGRTATRGAGERWLPLPEELAQQVAGYLDKQSLDSLAQASGSAHATVRALRPVPTLHGTTELIGAAKSAGAATIKKIRLTGDGQFDAGSLRILQAFEGLQELDLSGCTWLRDTDIGDLPRTLTRLDLSICIRLSKKCIPALPPQLKELDLSGCQAVAGADFAALPKTLRVLSLRGILQLADSAVGHLPRELLELDISGCRNLTGGMIEKIPRGVKKLDLGYLRNIYDDNLASLPPELEEIGLTSLQHLGDPCVNHLPDSLKRVDVSLCGGVSDAALAPLVEKGVKVVRNFRP